MKLVIVVPAFNESKIIGTVLRSIPKSLNGISQTKIVVVDDGSLDGTFKKAQEANVFILKHVLNRGAGAATKTGMDFAKSQGADIIVTFDADGQHSPNDIEKIIKPILEGKADVVIGSRFKIKQQIPMDRFILNWVGNFITLVLFGAFSTDTQSGLRAFSKKAASLIDFKSDRMEFSSEIIGETRKHNLKIVEVPTSAIYTEYSREKGQKNSNALPIFIRSLVKFLR